VVLNLLPEAHPVECQPSKHQAHTVLPNLDSGASPPSNLSSSVATDSLLKPNQECNSQECSLKDTAMALRLSSSLRCRTLTVSHQPKDSSHHSSSSVDMASTSHLLRSE